jgi:hypothetical protein
VERIVDEALAQSPINTAIASAPFSLVMLNSFQHPLVFKNKEPNIPALPTSEFIPMNIGTRFPVAGAPFNQG